MQYMCITERKYQKHPLKLVYRGLGEITVFIKSGPLAVCGTYLLFTSLSGLSSQIDLYKFLINYGHMP